MSALVFLLAAGLALTDAGFAGYRDAAGRDGRIFKAEYYRQAIRRGLRAGLVVVVLAAAWVTTIALTADDWRLAIVSLDRAFLTLVVIGGGYATIVLSALGVWAIGEADLRSLASVLILGPFTLLRPWVIVGMATAGALAGGDARTAACVVLPCILQLMVEPWLGRAWPQRAATRLQP